mgnify:FL=1
MTEPTACSPYKMFGSKRNPASHNNSPLVGFDVNLDVGTNEWSKLKKTRVSGLLTTLAHNFVS